MKKSVNNSNYSKYLQSRSLLGLLYRNYILYPRLVTKLEGITLDFGCGIGDFLRFKEETIGVDINAVNVEICHTQGFNVQLIRDNGDIPFLSNFFDSIIMDNVLEHIPEYRVSHTLEELRRVLKVDGKLVIGVPGWKGYQSDTDHKVYYSQKNLIELLEKYGFFIEDSFSMPLPWNWLSHYLRQYCFYGRFILQDI